MCMVKKNGLLECSLIFHPESQQDPITFSVKEDLVLKLHYNEIKKIGDA